MKYTCQPPENSLDELGIPKKPYFDPSHVSVASFCLISEGGLIWPFLIPTDTGLRLEEYINHLICFITTDMPFSFKNDKEHQ